jgi:3'-5' exoribonuclease
MKSPYVTELKPDQIVTGSFLVCSKEIRQKKKGDPYLSLQLGDRSGELDAKMWDNVAEVMETFERDDFVKVKGLVQIFHNRPQLTVHTIHRMDDREVDFADYFPASARDRDEMWRELRGFAAAIANPHLHKLLAALLDDEDIARRYRVAPAAKQIHHAYLGGLIEHVLSLCHLAKMTAAHYPDVDFDLLLAGVILHDVGKIEELSYARGFRYSTVGQLLGHIVIGMRMVEEKLREVPDFPAPLRDLLLHMILSHHGEMEFGSPKVPMFAEAVLLHHLDNLDSKMECVRGMIERDRLVEGVWTGYSSALDRTVLKKRKYLELEPAPQPEPAPAAFVKPAPPPEKPSAVEPPKHPPAPSPFGDKLLTALQQEK